LKLGVERVTQGVETRLPAALIGEGDVGGLEEFAEANHVGDFAGKDPVRLRRIGGALLEAGNQYIAGGSMDWGGVVLAGLFAAGLTGLFGGGCFVAGTPVLLGDGITKESIDNLHVGQRVKTDGGVANSADGKTAAADPSATAVDPKTWRLVTIDTDDAEGGWQVQALEPVSWIKANGVGRGKSIHLADVVDLAEMGATDDVVGTIESVTACPKIEGGPGRVILTTVSHLNDNVYDLTLTGAGGMEDTLGVTGTHRFYDESAGWVHTSDLYVGELLRGDHGDVKVTQLTYQPGMDRVYNMTVEGDHVYYVGDLSTLTHNEGCGRGGSYNKVKGLGTLGDGVTSHHMPRAALEFTKYGQGGALGLPEIIHKLTRTFGSKGAATAIEDAGLSFRDVLAKDIADLKKIVGSAYNSGIKEMIDYYEENFPELIGK
jgi:hypothetical protein